MILRLQIPGEINAKNENMPNAGVQEGCKTGTLLQFVVVQVAWVGTQLPVATSVFHSEFLFFAGSE